MQASPRLIFWPPPNETNDYRPVLVSVEIRDEEFRLRLGEACAFLFPEQSPGAGPFGDHCPYTRMKPVVDDTGAVAVRFDVVDPMLFHTRSVRLVLNCSWNGGLP